MTVLILPENALEELCSVPRPHTEIYNLSAFPMTMRLTPTTITGRNGKVIDVIEWMEEVKVMIFLDGHGPETAGPGKIHESFQSASPVRTKL